MDKRIALEKLQPLVGKDLRALADQHGVTVWKNGRINKGWAGHTIERHLGLPLNASRDPNLGGWELKLASLKRKKDGSTVVKETMQITMIDPVEVCQNSFEESHLFRKLRKIIAVARMWESSGELQSVCEFVHSFDLAETDLYTDVENDYNLIREAITKEGFGHLTGYMGKYIQPRTKGPGHGSTSRAFYARKEFVEYIIGMRQSPRTLYAIPEMPAPALVAETRTPDYSSKERRPL